MFHIVKPNTQFDFVGRRYIWLGISGAAIIATLVLFFVKGLNYGIDFEGGAEVHVRVPISWNISKVREELQSAGIQGLKVQGIGEPSSNEYLVRALGDEGSLAKVSGQVEGVFSKNFKKGEYEILRADVVGAAAGSLLRQKGLLAMFYALFVILVYVAIRFDSRYAPGAVIALFHDALVIVGVFILTGKQFDLTILAAVLALMGYSNNDTIIVFDRVRETLHNHPGWSIEKAVNQSINDTLGRTLMTSLTTFLVVAALYFFGGDTLKNFAFALMLGVVVGTYSSIFIASTLIIFLTNRRKNKEIMVKTGGTGGKKKGRKVYKVRPDPKEA